MSDWLRKLLLRWLGIEPRPEYFISAGSLAQFEQDYPDLAKYMQHYGNVKWRRP